LVLQALWRDGEAAMTDHLPSKERDKLIIELRGWHTLKGADCFRQAADEIERLREELAREVGTREARVAEIDALRRKVNELSTHAEKWVKRALGSAQPPGSLDAKVGALLIGRGYLDRMKDQTDEDTAARIVHEFLAEARPIISAHYGRAPGDQS
jgi:hypothetical protein